MLFVLAALSAAALLPRVSSAYDENTIVNARVKVAHLREASKLFTRIFKSWPTENYTPDFTPWALYAAGGARDAPQVCQTLQKIGATILKDKEDTLSRDALQSYRDLANLTDCKIPGLELSKPHLERILKSTDRGHDLGTSLRNFDARDLDLEGWLKFAREWESKLQHALYPDLSTYDDLFGLQDAKSYLIASLGHNPEELLNKLVELTRDPLYNLSLLDDDEFTTRLRSLQSLTRTFTHMIKDFGLETLHRYTQFESLKYSMYCLALSLVNTLSQDKPGSLGSLKLSYLLTALWRLEQSGLIYLSSRETAGSWDITLSRPLQRWDLGLYLKLDPADEALWRLTSDESASYSLHPITADTESPSPELTPPVIKVLNQKDEIVAKYQPGVEPTVRYPSNVPMTFYKLTRDTRLEEFDGSSQTFNVSRIHALIIIGSSFGDENLWSVQLCTSGGRSICKDIPVFQGHLGLDAVQIPLVSLAHDRFSVDIEYPPNSKQKSIHLDVALEGKAYVFDEKKHKTRIHQEGRKWYIDTELDYTFPKEVQKPNYVATAIFTAAIWLSPILMLSRLRFLVPGDFYDMVSPFSLLRAFGRSYLGSKLLYLMTMVYYAILTSSLVYYWAFWKLIPYSRLLVPLITMGSILTLLTLAKLESQSRTASGNATKSVECEQGTKKVD